MGKLGCAWSSSVKIYDYLCKRLLITARMDKRKMERKKNRWRHAHCGAILYRERSEFNKKKEEKISVVYCILLTH